METTKTIFINSLKENRANAQLLPLIKELSFELGRKKLQRLKDPHQIQKRIGELFELFKHALDEESLKTPKALTHVIDGLVKAASFDKEEFLYKSIYEKEQLEKSILAQKHSIRALIATTFDTMEEVINTLEASDKEPLQKALHDSKLRGIEMLGILRETTEEALLTTIENGSDIQDTSTEITKVIAYQAILEGAFTKQRFLDIASSIIEVSIEIADEDQAFAKEILHGTIHGTKEGISKAVEKFKNDLKFAPEEVEALLGCDLSETRKELAKIDEQFVKMVRNCGMMSSGISAKIINELLEEELDNSLAKMQRITNEAREAVSERLEELKDNALQLEREFKEKASKKFGSLKKDVEELEKKASEKVETLKNNPKTQQATEEAKKLGKRAWESAKELVKTTKEKIKK